MILNVLVLVFRAFSFRKKSTSAPSRVATSNKVIGSNVLANKNVNVPMSTLVTKSPVTFSNKPERQKSQISNFFSVSSVSKSDLSPIGNCAPTVQSPAAVTMSSNCQTISGSGGTSTYVDESLGFLLDEWDDFDDFETPSKSKNDSFEKEISGKSDKSVLSTSERKAEGDARIVGTETPEHRAEGSPEPGSIEEPSEQDDSPVKTRRRRLPAYVPKSVLSDSEEDNDDVPGPLEETTGNMDLNYSKYKGRTHVKE